MKITSPAFFNNQPIPSRHTCDGPDVNPPLVIQDVPAKSQSLVLIMEDPDVPKHLREDGNWDHWIVFNIPPDTKEIKENEEPPGVHGLGTSGNLDYHGPCPPDKKHRYFFKLYALDTNLDLPEGSTKTEILEVMQNHLVDQTELIGTYNRQS